MNEQNVAAINWKQALNKLILPVLDTDSVLSCVLNNDYIIYANQEFRTILNCSHNLSHTQFSEIISPEHRSLYLHEISELKKEKCINLKLNLRSGENTIVGVNLLAFSFTVFDQELIIMMGYSLDQYKNVKSDMELNQIRFYSMIEDMTEVVEMETQNNILLYVNDAYCRYFGKTREQLLGSSSNDLIHADDVNKVLDLLDSLTPENPCTTIEAQVKRGDGEIGWMCWTVRGFFDDKGKLIGHQSVGRDQTELKRFQRQLELSEARYRAIVEDQTEMIVRYRPDNVLMFANDAYCRFYNSSIKELIGKTVPCNNTECLSVISVDNPTTVCEEKIIQDDSMFWIEWTARGFFNEDGQLIEIQKVGRNITDRKKAEEELQKTKNDLEIRVMERTAELQEANRELTILNKNLQNIFIDIPSGVMVADKKGKVNQLNSYLKGFYGEVDEEINSIIKDYITKKKNYYLNKLFDNKESFQDVEFIFPTSRGDIYCLLSGINIENAENNSNSGLILINPLKEVQKLVNRFSGATARFTFKDIISDDDKMQLAIKYAQQAANSNGNVLITGESGTGKEMFAQAIHNKSKQVRGPFVAVNCGAIPRELLASELFGYVEGAFTGAKKGGNPGKFELASGGTLFLDEIGDMPIEQQVALLRVIQEKCFTRVGGNKIIPIDVRIICATNRDLLQEIAKGNFRQDLYYRLNVIHINIPPLRERPQDIILLFKEFLKKSDIDKRYDINRIHPEILFNLQKYNWPGNVRELQNVVERMLNFADGNPLTLKHLPSDLFSFINTSIDEVKLQEEEKQQSIKEIREQNKELKAEWECQEIMRLLGIYNWNISRVAREMNMARSTLYAKMEKYHIDN